MTITLNGTTGITTPDVNSDGLTVDSTTLVVDEANDRVGIGTSSPRSILNPRGSGATGAVLTLENSSTAVGSGEALGSLEFYSNDASSGGAGVKGKIASIDDTGFGHGGYASTDHHHFSIFDYHTALFICPIFS